MIHDVKNQHYVWRFYLKPWLDTDKIWCFTEGRVEKRRIKKIVKDIYFYRAEILTENEKMLVKALISKGDNSSHSLLNTIYSIFDEASIGDDFQKNNTIESYQSFVERSAIDLLKKVYNNDLSFWDVEFERTIFSHYLGMQYTRTKKDRDSVVAAFEPLENHPGNPGDINPKKIANALALIDAERIGNWIFSLSKPKLIELDGEIGLLTCDQPIYNLYALNKKNNLDPVDKMELYYPLSPNKALVLTENEHEIKPVDYYNEFILSIASDYVFSQSEKDLLYYVRRT